jgi:putative transposon-encoded protein
MKNKKFKPSFRITDRTNEHAAKYLSTALIIFKLRLGKIIKAIGEYSSRISKSGNSGHIIVPKDWIGHEVVVKIKEDRK